jgi:hypothetical protein
MKVTNKNLDDFLRDPDTPITKTSAIRLKCLDCCGNQRTEVKKCTALLCPLWSYRMGGAWRKTDAENTQNPGA